MVTGRDDFASISKLIFEYAERVDSGDLSGVADLLADAGFGRSSGDLLHGRDRIQAVFERSIRIYEDGTPRTKHLVTNVAIEVDAQARMASARSYWTVLQVVAGLGLSPILSGRYLDRFSSRNDAWRFTERRIATDLVGDATQHLLPGAPGLQ
jgi:SnoaL-like domain